MSEMQVREAESEPLLAEIDLQAARRKAARKGIRWLVGAAVIWGTVGVSSALLNRIEQTPPLTVGFLRLAFAAPFLLAVAWISIGHNPLRVRPRNLPIFGALGLAMAFYQLFYFAAIPISSVTLVVVIALCSAPLLVALISIPVFKERLTGMLIAALGLALVGTGLLALGGSSGTGGELFKPEYLLGALLALGAGFSYALLTIFSRIAAQRENTNPIQALALSFTFGAVVLLGAALASGSLKLELAAGVWLISAYLGIIPTGLAYIIFIKALQNASATAASITTLLEPAVAALLAWWLLGESISFLTVLGAGLLLTSVWLLSRR